MRGSPATGRTALMAIEFRPVTDGEIRDYLRVLPYVNGLPQEEPRPSA